MSVLCWYCLGSEPMTPSNSVIYTAMNAFIHTVMYSYYCLRSARIPVAKPLQMSITVMQIVQMVFGTILCCSELYYRHLTNQPCDSDGKAAWLGAAIYLSYFYLFSLFFYNFYIAPSKKAAIEKKD